MKKLVPVLVFVLLSAGIAIINSCKKDDVIPTLTTNAITNITINSFTGGGSITKDGGAAVTARGVCWGTSENPVASGSHTSDDKGIGSFVSTVTGLTPNTVYHVRAYATNKVGTAYGEDLSFSTTALVLATLTTTEASTITLTTAVSGGNISSDGNAAVTAKGICWSTTANPTITDPKTSDGTGAGAFTSTITGLTPGTLYHARAYATNSVGTSYGNDITFTTTSVVLATLTTTTATLVTLNSAVTGGNITSDGGGAVTARGVCYATTANPTINNPKTSDATGTGSFISTLSGLNPGTLYHIRAYATNSAGTAYGNDLTFSTNPVGAPTLTTSTVTSITLTSGVSGGNITSDGGGAVTVRGVCWATTNNPTVLLTTKTTDGAGTGAFTSSITGLTPGTTYYVRAYATNSAGTGYGNEVSFTANQIVVPTLTTSTVSGITISTAISGGVILTTGGGTITGRGVCWALTANPTVANSVTNDGTGTGTFVSTLTGLAAATTYHVRAYAANSAGTAYGNDLTFTTSPVALATLSTTIATAITQTTATSGGIISADGGGTITARGVCWALTANPTVALTTKTTDGTGTGTFPSSITGLTSGTTYHIRAYATNSAGTAYGSDLTFTTNAATMPTLTTVAASSVTSTTAASGGNISSDGNGAISVKGVCWSTTINPTTSDPKTSDGSGSANFTSSISGLLPGTIYHVRAFATNVAGTAYGNDVTLTTVPTAVPSLTTTAMSSVLVTTASSGGIITVAGAGTVLDRGVCWSTSVLPTILDSKRSDGTGTGTFTSNVTGLLPGTTYYLRAFATNSFGTGYGAQVTFTTKIEDTDHNSYDIVTIGTQVWMKQNLATLHYNNGDPILTSSTYDISGETTPKYQWVYNDNEANAAIYGRLYTFYAVTDPRGVCPTGYHVPTDAEWNDLATYLANNGFAFTSGLDDIAKSMAATSGWAADPTPGNIGNDMASNNASGFTALPGGFLQSNIRSYSTLGTKGYWGSSSVGATPGSTAWYRNLNNNFAILGRNDYGPWNGYSIRCVK
jgi:uncharacterized protein (TIGR02145 family)